MFCKKCGSKIKKKESFCSQCGISVGETAQKTVKQTSNSTKPAAPRTGLISWLKPKLAPIAQKIGWRLTILAVALVVGVVVYGAVWLLWPELRGEVVKEQSETMTLSGETNNELKLEDLTFTLPEGSIEGTADLTISKVADRSVPKLPVDTQIVSDVFDISTEANITADKPAYMTLSYSDAVLPSDAEPEQVYMAHWTGEEWQPVPGASVDSETKTITAPVEDFSIFTLLFNPILAFSQVDIIRGVDRFADLPNSVKQDLDSQYSQSSIKSSVYWQVSPVSQFASQTLLGANFVNQIAGGVIAAAEGGQDMVLDWLVEEIALKAAGHVITATAGEEAANITLAIYDTASTGSELYSEGFSAIKNTPMLQAKAVAWVLAREMEYINEHVGEGYSQIATKNLWSMDGEPLKIYIVTLHGENKTTGRMDKGVKYYYYYSTERTYKNYANAVVGTELKEVEVEGGEEEEADEEEDEPEETTKPTSTPAKQTSSSSGCQTLNIKENAKSYTSSDQAFPCSSFTTSLTSSKYSVRCPNRTSRWRAQYAREIPTNGASSLQIKANLGLNVIDKFFTENNGIGVKYDDYVDLIILSSDPNPELASECNKTWNNSTKPARCAIQNTDPSVIGHCGVKKYTASRTCDFKVSTSGLSKVWAVLRVADAWPADPEGSLSNLQACY